MSSVVISGDTSGAITVSAPAVSGTNTLTLQAGTGTNSMNTLATAVASTSGTSIDFTGLPSWVKRITVMFSGVSSNGTSNWLIQLGDAGGIENTGYFSSMLGVNPTPTTSVEINTTGFLAGDPSVTADLLYGSVVLSLVGSNAWVSAGNVTRDGVTDSFFSVAGGKTLSDTLTQVRITTVNGTDTFDAGTINILYEG
jgi:hypothetical protein